MQYQKVFINNFAYELPHEVVSSEDVEELLAPVYKKLHIPKGQVEALTGIKERRWWPENQMVSTGATVAAEKSLRKAGLKASDLDALIFAGVCRDYFEPATACRIGANLGLKASAVAYDISNACLGVMNGILDIANRIELGQIQAGMVVSCETSRDVTLDIINQLKQTPEMDLFKTSLATLTGGSGAAAVLLTSQNIGQSQHQLVGGVTHSALEHHDLCRWGVRKMPQVSMLEQFFIADAVSVLKFGLSLGAKTWSLLMQELGWCREIVDKVISHQVGRAHRTSILQSLGIPEDMDFPTFEYLGNIGTVSLPLTAAMAGERGFLSRGDQVGLLGIGSGLNCLMMGVKW